MELFLHLLGGHTTICKECLVISLNQICMYLGWVIPWVTSMMDVSLNLSFTDPVNYQIFQPKKKKKSFSFLIRCFTFLHLFLLVCI